ncbi:MAG: hypothetical protein QXV17_13815 [Candidatus Micrarchaeaceae archaeon]
MGIMMQRFYVEDVETTWGYGYVGKDFVIEGYITRDFSTISEKPYDIKVYKLSKADNGVIEASRFSKSKSFEGAVRIMERYARKLIGDC